MDFCSEYNLIIKNLQNGPVEIHTIPLSNRNGLWFSVIYENKKIFVYPAEKHSPSSKIKKISISKDTLSKMYPIYIRRRNGEQVSYEAQNTCFVQVYCYGIFEFLGSNNEKK